MDKEPEFLIICSSTSYMLMGEKQLRQRNINVELVPAPASQGYPCETAIKVGERDVELAKEVLRVNKIAVEAVFRAENKLKLHFVEGFSSAARKIINKLEDGIELINSEVTSLLNLSGMEERALLKLAEQVTQKSFGSRVDIRAAVEFSNYCTKNCCYCGLRRENKKLQRYRMGKEELVELAIQLKSQGFHTIILQSGEDPWYTTAKIVELIKEIKEKTGLRITLSIGERSFQDYKIFKDNGANNYLLKIESANKTLFEILHPDDNYEVRVNCTKWLKNLGYVTGSGNIVGLPGQTVEHLAEDLLFLKRNHIHMLGIGPFLPAKNTPLENFPPGDKNLTLRVMAVARIIMPNAFIPATTALASLEPDAQVEGLRAGANTIMIIATPQKYRGLYEIYSQKKPVDLEGTLKVIVRAGRKPPKYIGEKVSR